MVDYPLPLPIRRGVVEMKALDRYKLPKVIYSSLSDSSAVGSVAALDADGRRFESFLSDQICGSVNREIIEPTVKS